MIIQFSPDHPPFQPGSTLPAMPRLTYTPLPPTEAEEMLLTMLRPYYDDPETLFLVFDALFAYYHDELAA